MASHTDEFLSSSASSLFQDPHMQGEKDVFSWLMSHLRAGAGPVWGCACVQWRDLEAFGFLMVSFPLECWFHPCLSEIDKAMEKVSLWLGARREALGELGIFLPSQEKSVLYLTCPLFAPGFRNSYVSFPHTDFVAQKLMNELRHASCHGKQLPRYWSPILGSGSEWSVGRWIVEREPSFFFT